MEDVGTAEERFSVDFVLVESNIGEREYFSIAYVFEVIDLNLVGQKLIESAVEDVLDEVADRTDVCYFAHHFPQ